MTGLPTPPIHSTRLLLRAWRPEDASALVHAWTLPDIVAGTAVPDDPTPETAERWIAGWDERRSRGIALDLVVTPAAEPDRLLGEVGLVLVHPDRGWAEIGWWLLPEARGRGHASEAVRALANAALTDTGPVRLFARVPAHNHASERVARTAGLALTGRTEDGTGVWVRDRPDPSTAPDC